MVTVGNAATLTEKEVKKRYPVEEGLTAGTTKQTKEKFLKPQGYNGITTRVAARKKAGL